MRHGPLRPAVFGHPSGARSVPAAGDSGGRGLGVPGGVRGACAEREILLFELPPRSPKLNGRVERANRTHTEEFYEVYELPWTVASLNVRLREWEQVYNHIRPHWALDYLTPAQVLETFKKTAPVSHMSLPAFPIWIIRFDRPKGAFSCKISVLASPCHVLAGEPYG